MPEYRLELHEYTGVTNDSVDVGVIDCGHVVCMTPNGATEVARKIASDFWYNQAEESIVHKHGFYVLVFNDKDEAVSKCWPAATEYYSGYSNNYRAYGKYPD